MTTKLIPHAGGHLIECGPSRRGAHRLEAIMRCPRYYAYKYLLNLGVNSSPLERGSLGHTGLSHYYARMGARQRGADQSYFLEPLVAMQIVAEERDLTRAAFYDPLRAAVDRYGEYWQGWHDEEKTWEILEVEKEHETTVDGYPFTGRFDLVVRDRTGRILLVDHKFVAALKADTATRYTLSLQFLGYQRMASEAYGKEFGGVLINFVQVQNGALCYRRVQLPPAPAALSFFEQQVRDAEQRIEMFAGREPWEYPGAFTETVCVHSYGLCSGMELCRWGQGKLDHWEGLKGFMENQTAAARDERLAETAKHAALKP